MESSQHNQFDRELIVATARTLLRPRVLFRPYGRDPKYGMDCIGVVVWVGKQCGCLKGDYEPPLYAYPPQAEVFEQFDHLGVRREGPAHGAVAIFGRNHPQHSGIVAWSDGRWKLIGIDLNGHRPFVTITPMNVEHVWRFYDFRLAQS
jgi:hypothetical protein